MTNIKVITSDDGYMKIEADEHSKNPIVCASISTLLQSHVRFLQELSVQYPNDIKVEVEYKG